MRSGKFSLAQPTSPGIASSPCNTQASLPTWYTTVTRLLGGQPSCYPRCPLVELFLPLNFLPTSALSGIGVLLPCSNHRSPFSATLTLNHITSVYYLCVCSSRCVTHRLRCLPRIRPRIPQCWPTQRSSYQSESQRLICMNILHESCLRQKTKTLAASQHHPGLYTQGHKIKTLRIMTDKTPWASQPQNPYTIPNRDLYLYRRLQTYIHKTKHNPSLRTRNASP